MLIILLEYLPAYVYANLILSHLSLFSYLLFLFKKEHSWRHKEFKKFSNKSSKILYSNAAILSYRDEQYMSATRALQHIFPKRNQVINK